jgi:hypothetical protein
MRTRGYAVVNVPVRIIRGGLRHGVPESRRESRAGTRSGGQNPTKGMRDDTEGKSEPHIRRETARNARNRDDQETPSGSGTAREAVLAARRCVPSDVVPVPTAV